MPVDFFIGIKPKYQVHTTIIGYYCFLHQFYINLCIIRFFTASCISLSLKRTAPYNKYTHIAVACLFLKKFSFKKKYNTKKNHTCTSIIIKQNQLTTTSTRSSPQPNTKDTLQYIKPITQTAFSASMLLFTSIIYYNQR